MIVTLAFFNDRPPLVIYENAVELSSTPEQIARDCGSGLGGCVLIFPNYKGDKCFIVVPKTPEATRKKWFNLASKDCQDWSTK